MRTFIIHTKGDTFRKINVSENCVLNKEEIAKNFDPNYKYILEIS